MIAMAISSRFSDDETGLAGCVDMIAMAWYAVRLLSRRLVSR